MFVRETFYPYTYLSLFSFRWMESWYIWSVMWPSVNKNKRNTSWLLNIKHVSSLSVPIMPGEMDGCRDSRSFSLWILSALRGAEATWQHIAAPLIRSNSQSKETTAAYGRHISSSSLAHFDISLVRSSSVSKPTTETDRSSSTEPGTHFQHTWRLNDTTKTCWTKTQRIRVLHLCLPYLLTPSTPEWELQSRVWTLQSVEASRVCVFKHWRQINISEFHETNYITESCDTTQIQPVLPSTTWSTSWWTDLRSACRFTAGSLTLDGDDLTRRRSFSCSTHQPKENTATLIWNRNKNKKVFLHLTWD